jgi:hypothetical protein
VLAPAEQQDTEGERVGVEHPSNSDGLMARSCWIDGSATFTTVLSSMIMNSPTATAARVHHRRFSEAKRRALIPPRSSRVQHQRRAPRARGKRLPHRRDDEAPRQTTTPRTAAQPRRCGPSPGRSCRSVAAARQRFREDRNNLRTGPLKSRRLRGNRAPPRRPPAERRHQPAGTWSGAARSSAPRFTPSAQTTAGFS